jgi:hypothetical protein
MVRRALLIGTSQHGVGDAKVLFLIAPQFISILPHTFIFQRAKGVIGSVLFPGLGVCLSCVFHRLFQ